MDLANFIINKGKEAGLTQDQISGILLSASRKLSGNIPEEKWEEQVLEWINKRAQKNIKNDEEIKLENKNIYADNCPADAIREYIERITAEQRKYKAEGKEIPQDLLIPQRIVLSPENIKFLLDSKYVDFVGAGETGNEVQFYWKKTEELPALEVRVKREEDGKFILTYIKEEATEDREEFVWDKESESGKKGLVTISKTTDALEDICEMDEEEIR